MKGWCGVIFRGGNVWWVDNWKNLERFLSWLFMVSRVNNGEKRKC